ncbi:MAG: hypothetical protein ACI9S8_000356 [Chlamydiales bacterium]|jgi:hypothetical protein
MGITVPPPPHSEPWDPGAGKSEGRYRRLKKKALSSPKIQNITILFRERISPRGRSESKRRDLNAKHTGEEPRIQHFRESLNSLDNPLPSKTSPESTAYPSDNDSPSREAGKTSTVPSPIEGGSHEASVADEHEYQSLENNFQPQAEITQAEDVKVEIPVIIGPKSPETLEEELLNELSKMENSEIPQMQIIRSSINQIITFFEGMEVSSEKGPVILKPRAFSTPEFLQKDFLPKKPIDSSDILSKLPETLTVEKTDTLSTLLSKITLPRFGHTALTKLAPTKVNTYIKKKFYGDLKNIKTDYEVFKNGGDAASFVNSMMTRYDIAKT